MIRTLRYCLTFMLLTIVAVVNAQNEGVPQPKENALDLAFQKPEQWTGRDYDHATTFLERSYVMTGIGTDGIWGMSELFGRSTNGFFGAIDFGHWVAPVHGYEVGLNYGLLPVLDWKISRFGTNYSEPSCIRYFSVSGSYLFNITSYAQKRQSPARWEWIAKAGVDFRIQDIVALGVNTAMRCQYNITHEVGLYIEPQLGVYTNALDNETISPNFSTHILPSISAGVAIRLERSKGYRKKGYVEPSDRVKAYIESHGEERNVADRLFGRRLNADIIADTVSQAYLDRQRLDSLQADSLRKIVVVPTDSVGLAKYRADSLKQVMSLRADSIRRAVLVADSLKQIAIMRKDSAGRAVLAADSLRRLDIARADSLLREERAKFVADSLSKVEYERNHKYHCGKVAVSTNMLYWAAAIPNIGIEIPIKNHYSVAMSYMFPWFANYTAGFSYRLLNWDVEGRYWLNGTTKLRGLYGGIYGSVGYYDMMNGDKGCQGDLLYSGGVSAGYSLPLGPTMSLNMSIGVGILSTNYSSYHEEEGYLVYDSKHSFSSIGPTKASIGITWSPEFDFQNTAMFNRSVRLESKAERAVHKVERDSLQQRNIERAKEAKNQEEQWREEQKLAKKQIREEESVAREEEKAAAEAEREAAQAEAAEKKAAEKAKAAKAKSRGEGDATESSEVDMSMMSEDMAALIAETMDMSAAEEVSAEGAKSDKKSKAPKADSKKNKAQETKK